MSKFDIKNNKIISGFLLSTIMLANITLNSFAGRVKAA